MRVPVAHLELQHIEVQDVRNDGSTPLIAALEGAPAKVKNDFWQNWFSKGCILCIVSVVSL